MSRNRAQELHRMQFTNKPIGSSLLVGQNPRNKRFPRHGKYTERIPKKMYFKQANNGFMIMGQPTSGPSLDMESLQKRIDGMIMRAVGERKPQQVTQRLDEQILNKMNEMSETLDRRALQSRSEHEGVPFAQAEFAGAGVYEIGSSLGSPDPPSPTPSELEGAFSETTVSTVTPSEQERIDEILDE